MKTNPLRPLFLASGMTLLLVSQPSLLLSPIHGVADAATNGSYSATQIYSNSKCSETPNLISISLSKANCVEDVACAVAGDNATYSSKVVCSSDYLAQVKTVFASTGYVVAEVYADTDCSGTPVYASAIPAGGSCIVQKKNSFKADVNTNGSASITYYKSLNCTGEVTQQIAVSSADLTTHKCSESVKYYAGTATTTTTSGANALHGVAVTSLLALVANWMMH